MSVESQVPLGAAPHVHPDKISVQDGDLGIILSAPNVVPQLTEKKPTRQWAAWTRQEEEIFFTALRQVGKNFEKITRRVQSKNKDQTLLLSPCKAMNKLLGPELCLDAKNSKDTNAAMLRWWSLLKKYSCKASKLHLKPRRFKIFVDALEHQLMKDRKKNVRKHSSQGGNFSPTAENSISNPSASGHDSRTVKLVLVDSQTIQKLGSGKGSLKHNNSIGVQRTNTKGDSTTMKASRQRRKPAGVGSSAAYKKWEKAAIAGVSLVADAAEHVERTATDKDVENDQGQEVIDPVENALPPFPPFSHSPLGENNVHNSMKLKLQLFPIDEGTRNFLETEKHNPHLELTLSSRKKISSVMEHLHHKWGHSSVASGELILFPYNTQRENLASHHRWTQDSIFSAADVHAIVGSPPLFRLRYGWISNIQLGSFVSQTPLASCFVSHMHNLNVETTKENITDSAPVVVPSTNEIRTNSCEDQPILVSENDGSVLPRNDAANEIRRYISADSGNNFVHSPDSTTNKHRHRKETSDERLMEDVDNPRASNGIALSAGEWADSLTNISVGDLLAEVPHEMDANFIEPSSIGGRSQYLQQCPFSCDSFDAAIAAHISKHQNKIGSQSTLASSIWDAEETCDAFSFRKNPVSCREAPETCQQITRTNSADSGGFFEEIPETGEPMEHPDDEAMGEDDCLSDPHTIDKDFNALTDVYWPDSLGPLDLDNPTSNYQNEDLILGNSLGGLSNLNSQQSRCFSKLLFFWLGEKRCNINTNTSRSSRDCLLGFQEWQLLVKKIRNLRELSSNQSLWH